MLKFLKSKKAWAAIAGTVACVGSNVLGLDPATVKSLVLVLGSYIVGQGLADLGKEAK